MPFDRPKQSFAGIEDKLRKLWNLAGVIGASFEAAIKPQLIVGDLREPGVASFSGRHWAWVSDEQGPGLPASAGVIGFKFAQTILLDGVWVKGGTNATGFVGVYQTTPDMTVPLALTRASGCWIDQRVSLTDVPPCLDVATWAAANGAAYAAMRVSACRMAVLSCNSGGGTASNGILSMEWKYGAHIPAGNSIYYDIQPLAAGMTGVHLGAYGRIA